MSCSIVHPITGVTHYLHSASVMNNPRHDKNRVIYYFSKEIVDALDLPDGWEVKTAPIKGKYGHGMPYLRKIRINEKTDPAGI